MRVEPCTLRHLMATPQVDLTDSWAVIEHVRSLPDNEALLHRNARALVGDEGDVWACYGVWPMWGGVGRAWALLSKESTSRYALSLHRGARAALSEIIERDRLHRVEAVVRAGFPAGCQWIRRLGFVRECTMGRYGPDQADYHLFARTHSWTPS